MASATSFVGFVETDDAGVARAVVARGAAPAVEPTTVRERAGSQIWAAYERVRAASDTTGRAVGILGDLQGPKLRLGRFGERKPYHL